ncbi:glutamate-1-semialdehyde 2,1-aminomutase [Clostridiales bacterium F-3ap]|uniref:Glutamate-1-semialdehyde 2,1-aminomutase n=1 Tax=Anaerotalea alkaliphila TaxID=2662126 RepID=A0A7X5KLT3_9FIRM|nr:glutamate-1-semialdehyde 2,1-aminomutase [Anaerotalea alkaliphila]
MRMMDTARSDKLFERAREVIPGGVNSPVRAFASVGRHPLFVERAEGARVWDVDGNAFIDYIGSWGPSILGHASPVALEGIGEQALKGTTYGLPTELEIQMAEQIVEAFPGMDMVRMVNSGTEATMSAIRLARGFTGREMVVKFEGCYHGHADQLLVKSGSGALTLGIPTSAGVPGESTRNTLVGSYNDLQGLEELFRNNGGRIAAVIMEPVPGNMGVVAPREGFLMGVRSLCDRHGSLLIFDEVISGFRLAYGGAQTVYGIRPDITCLGKIIGGGLPVGAYGGRREIMSRVAPAGDVYQAGTLSGNPLAMRMGLQVLRHLAKHPEFYRELEEKARFLEEGFGANLRRCGVEAAVNRVGTMVCQFFAKGPVETYRQVMESDTKRYAAYFNRMLEQGILMPPSQFEALFLSGAHEERMLEMTVSAHGKAMETLAEL